MSVSAALYSAIRHDTQAKISNARATLLIYFTNPVGIGEHPQHLEEMTKLLDEISQAEDRLSTLDNHFSEFSNGQLSQTNS